MTTLDSNLCQRTWRSDEPARSEDAYRQHRCGRWMDHNERTHCARMAFVGLSDSYEAYYQCIRRCYRYGQTRPVIVHLVLSELEHQIATNVRRKERDAARFTAELVEQMRAAEHWSLAA